MLRRAPFSRTPADECVWRRSVIVGIDFTGSNGHPMTPDSLHYMVRRDAAGMPCMPPAGAAVCGIRG